MNAALETFNSDSSLVITCFIFNVSVDDGQAYRLNLPGTERGV